MEKQTLSPKQLVFLALCCAAGLFSKRIFSPLINLLTDLMHIPGGGIVCALSLSFLVLARAVVRWPWAASAMSAVQGMLALMLGMAGPQGLLAPVTYALPGLAIDLIFRLMPSRSVSAQIFAACAVSPLCSAGFSGILIFRLNGLPLAIWLATALLCGIVCGLILQAVFLRVLSLQQTGGFA